MTEQPEFKVTYLEPTEVDAEPLPEDFSGRRLRRSLLILVAIATVIVLLVLLLPGLSSLRESFDGADPAWIWLGVAFELLSCTSYVLVFRAVFCSRMSWRTSTEIGLSEQAANSLLSVGGAGGLALGAWILRRGGVPADQIARRTVAFFLLTSLANVGFLALGGLALATGLMSGPSNPLLGIVPAIVGIGATALALTARRAARALGARSERPRLQAILGAVGDGVDEAVGLLRSPAMGIGSAGYMLFDIAVLAVCFPAFGNPLPPLDALLLAYIIGQLGGLVPLPGGIGGLDLGLIGALVLYGIDATDAAVAVLTYRGVLLAVPALVGLPALAILQRRLRTEDHDIAACAPGQEVEVVGLGRVLMPVPRTPD
ncbi:MAG TPA: lysylphosphatidylglycerol synthase domain-containing protein [Solirubrobacterales bacterium]|nr:lysylphosphatidylglycerol synthase domain-containing protein [Solirubrobacterales bacterium]